MAKKKKTKPVVFKVKSGKAPESYEITVAKKQTMDDILISLVVRKDALTAALCGEGTNDDDSILVAQMRVVNEVINKLNLMREKL